MKIGLGQFTLQIPPWDHRDHAQLCADVLDLAARADALGFDSLWIAEHHGSADGYNPSSLPFLAAVAARTKRIELGAAVLLAPFHHPLRVAEDAAVVDNISGGRLQIGLGLGWSPEEYRMFGVDPKGRGKRLEELAQVLKRAWNNDRFSFTGEFFSFEDVGVTPKPARPGGPPLWLGGNAEHALRRAARIADGHFPPMSHGIDALAERARAILALRREMGLQGPYRFGAFQPVGIGRDADDAWASIRDGFLHTQGSYVLWRRGERDVSRAREAVAAAEEEIRAGCVLGTPEQVAERLRAVADEIDGMGFEEVFLSALLVPPGMPAARAVEAMERFGAEVMPALRG